MIDKLIGDEVMALYLPMLGRFEEAAGGEILVSGRLAERLGEPPGERLELELKGKAEPVAAYRSVLE